MNNAVQNRQQIEDIKTRMLQGDISFEAAKVLMIPIVDDINRRGKEIAAKYGRRYSPVTVGYLLR